jgi:hypothetical protein
LIDSKTSIKPISKRKTKQILRKPTIQFLKGKPKSNISQLLFSNPKKYQTNP